MDSYTRLRSDSCDRFYARSPLRKSPSTSSFAVSKLRFFLFCPWVLGDQRMRISEVRKISSEKSFVGSRAVPYDAELIAYNLVSEKGRIIVKKTNMLIAVVFVVGAIAQSARAQTLVSFSGGIGDITTGSTNTTVRGVAAAGQIWVIRDLTADVKQDGSIRVDGRGLLLGAGESLSLMRKSPFTSS